MLSSLNSALTGLNVSKLQVENIMNNIANENTPGYKKRTVNIEELALVDSSTYGRGVGVTDVSRSTNQYMFDNILIENGKSSYYDSMSQLLGDVESIFKETDESGFSHDIDNYFQAIENLRTNPNSEIYKTDLMNQGNILVDTMNRLYDGIETQEKVLNDSLEEEVAKVNSILDEMGKINQELANLKSSSNDLLDKRDQLELELSTYVDIEIDRSDYDYELRIGGRVALRYGDNIRSFTVTEDKLSQTDRYLKDDGVTSSIVPPSGNFDVGDRIIYKLDNNAEVIVNFGDMVDVDGDGSLAAVDNTNYLRALVSKINSSSDMKDQVTAYNGQYSVDANGNKSDVLTSDKYLFIESDKGGPEGDFSGRVVIEEYTVAGNTDVSNLENSGLSKEVFYRTDSQSSDGKNDIHVQLFDEEVTMTSGSIKAKIDNLKTDSSKNLFQSYKDSLDQFAKTLSDLTSQFIQTSDEEYIYGEMTIDGHDTGDGTAISQNTTYIGNVTTADSRPDGLFTGSDVRSLEFNTSVVNYLDQNKLDYLSTLQWKEDISFKDGTQGKLTSSGDLEDVEANSFSEFFQNLKVNIASDKENNDFLMDTQEAVVQSLQASFDQISKVDNDEEMLNLIKFQAAYTANAKIVTVIDEMLQTLLAIR